MIVSGRAARTVASMGEGVVVRPDQVSLGVLSLDRWNCWNAARRVPTASAITQARKRLGRDVFPELFERCCGPVAGEAGPAAEGVSLGALARRREQSKSR